jgi:hypothetical protein
MSSINDFFSLVSLTWHVIKEQNQGKFNILLQEKQNNFPKRSCRCKS